MVTRLGYRYPRTVLGIRLAAALWVFILGLIVLSYGYWWGLLLIAASAGTVWVAHLVWEITRNRPPT